MADLTIRAAAPGDVSAMAELDRQCFADPWSEGAFRSELTENGRAFYIVAETEGQVVGYAGLWAILDEGHITNVAVAPEFRRRGVGKAIVATLLDASRQNGLSSFTLEVRESNLPAQGLYSQFGFRPAGIRKGYYQNNGENAIIMWANEGGGQQ